HQGAEPDQPGQRLGVAGGGRFLRPGRVVERLQVGLRDLAFEILGQRLERRGTMVGGRLGVDQQGRAARPAQAQASAQLAAGKPGEQGGRGGRGRLRLRRWRGRGRGRRRRRRRRRRGGGGGRRRRLRRGGRGLGRPGRLAGRGAVAAGRVHPGLDLLEQGQERV